MIGDGTILRLGHPAVDGLVEAYEELLRSLEQLEFDDNKLAVVAHAHLTEVADLLQGQQPVEQTEIDYVKARTISLSNLCQAVKGIGFENADSDRRRAAVQARLEIEMIEGGSALSEAAELIRVRRSPDNG